MLGRKSVFFSWTRTPTPDLAPLSRVFMALGTYVADTINKLLCCFFLIGLISVEKRRKKRESAAPNNDCIDG